MNRGTNRCPIFLDASFDRAVFKDTLSDAARIWKIRIHAFSLMDNHYHLLVETPLGNLSRAMRHIDGVYTQRFNRAHKRDGALFRGRYKAILVQEETYFLQLVRYIHLNGVKALLYPHASADPNCSHGFYIDLRPAPRWLCKDKTLSFFSQAANPTEALNAFVQQGVPKEIDDVLSRERWPAVLGLKDFIDNIKKRFLKPTTSHPELPEKNRLIAQASVPVHVVIDAVKQSYGIDNLSELNHREHAEARWAFCYLLRHHAQLENKRIGELLYGLSYSGVSRVLARNDFGSSQKFKNLEARMNTVSNGKTWTSPDLVDT